MQITKQDNTALLFGATGLVGGHCLNFLLENGHYDKVKVFGRREVLLKHPKLEQQLIDFDNLDNYSDLLRGADVYSCLGTTIKKAGSKEAFYKVDFTYNNNIAKITAQNGARQFFLVSSIGAYSNSIFFYNKVKGQLEEAVKHYPFEAVHILRPSVLVGEREESRTGEELAVKLGKAFDFLTSGVLLKYRPIEGKNVAKFMVLQANKGKKGVCIYESDEIQKSIQR